MPDTNRETAARIIRGLTGGRWNWPPVRVHDLYEVGPSRRVRLVGRPLLGVEEVLSYPDGVPLAYSVVGQYVRLVSAPDWCVGGKSEVEVVYSYGSRPPQIVESAVDVLASELEKAVRDPDACRLPDRVTSMTRQGVSWTLMDPMDILDKGRTGIYEIDLAIAALIGSKAKRRARVSSPEMPLPIRLSVEVLPEPDPVPAP